MNQVDATVFTLQLEEWTYLYLRYATVKLILTYRVSYPPTNSAVLLADNK